jgi:hypothetical protein
VAAIRATNRTQRLVLGFFVIASAALLAILLAAPDVYDATLKLGPGNAVAALVFLISISAFLTLLGIGVVRRWRWTFWLIVVAFLSGSVRVVVSALQVMNMLPAGGPAWYVALQAAIGAVQFVMALAMIAGYRKAGAWGAF